MQWIFVVPWSKLTVEVSWNTSSQRLALVQATTYELPDQGPRDSHRRSSPLEHGRGISPTNCEFYEACQDLLRHPPIHCPTHVKDNNDTSQV